MGVFKPDLVLVLRLLSRSFKELFPELRERISHLPLSMLEDLSEALLDFSSLDDVLAWLEADYTADKSKACRDAIYNFSTSFFWRCLMVKDN